MSEDDRGWIIVTTICFVLGLSLWIHKPGFDDDFAVITRVFGVVVTAISAAMGIMTIVDAISKE